MLRSIITRSTSAAIIAIVLLTLTTTASASSMERDELVGKVLALYEPGAETRPGSGTGLIKRAEREWDSFSKDQQKRLIQYLAEPVTDGPGAPDGQRSLETAHFQVFYMSSGTDAVPAGDADGNGAPDYADRVASYLETSWAKEVDEFGFKQPPGDGKLKVHIKKINHNGLTHAATGKTAWIEINNDIAPYTTNLLGGTIGEDFIADPEGLEAAMLKACCAHEFFHCIQASYDWDEENWWCEGTAEWMGDAVFPESKFYCNNVDPRFTKPHVSLFSTDGWFEYGASIWAFYLAENFDGATIIKQIWEGCADGGVRDATQQAVSDMAEQFEYYACYNYLRNYADGTRFPEMTVNVLPNIPGSFKPKSSEAPEHFGANYVAIDVPDGTDQLSVSVEVASDATAGTRILAIGDGTWKILPHTLQDNKLEVGIDCSSLQRLVVVISSFCGSGNMNYTVSVK